MQRNAVSQHGADAVRGGAHAALRVHLHAVVPGGIRFHVPPAAAQWDAVETEVGRWAGRAAAAELSEDRVPLGVGEGLAEERAEVGLDARAEDEDDLPAGQHREGERQQRLQHGHADELPWVLGAGDAERHAAQGDGGQAGQQRQ